MISLAAAFVVVLIALVCTRLWPLATVAVDPEKTPFLGPDQVNGFTMYTSTITDATGRFRSHKIILVFLAACVFAGGMGWLVNRQRCREWTISINLEKFARTRLVFLVVAILFLMPVLVGLRKVPDFSQRDQAHLAITNMHFSFIVGHADKLSQGDKLFETVSPKYGMLITVFVAGLEKAKGGLVSLGSMIRMMQVSELLYLFIALLLYWRWSGRRLLLVILPMLFLVKWFYSSSYAPVPMNHSPIRTAGIIVALVVVFHMQRVPLWGLGLACGGLSALALLNNVESGLACTVGLAAFLFIRTRKFGSPVFPVWTKMVSWFFAGFALVWLVFSLVCYRVLGVHFGVSGLTEYVFPAFRGAAGAWATNDPVGWWPVFMFLHVSMVVVYSAMAPRYTFKDAYRCGLGVMFLVWFAYFVNRPDPTYLCSFYFLYGFLVVDLQIQFLRNIRKKVNAGVSSSILGLSLILIISQAYDAVSWSLNPKKWGVNAIRWQVPLVRKGVPLTKDAVGVGHAYVAQPYAHSLVTRGNLLRDKAQAAGCKRLVYFTVDSFLMPRVSGILPWQEFPDPLEAMTKKHYDRMIQAVVSSPYDEIYFDVRDEKKLVYYTAMFQMVRRDLADHFQKAGVESGWEIWKRIPKN